MHLIEASKTVCWGFSESVGIVWGLEGGALWAVGEKTSEDTIPPGLGSASLLLLALGKIHLQTPPRKSWINYLGVLRGRGKRQTLWHPWLRRAVTTLTGHRPTGGTAEKTHMKNEKNLLKKDIGSQVNLFLKKGP